MTPYQFILIITTEVGTNNHKNSNTFIFVPERWQIELRGEQLKRSGNHRKNICI